VGEVDLVSFFFVSFYAIFSFFIFYFFVVCFALKESGSVGGR